MKTHKRDALLFFRSGPTLCFLATVYVTRTAVSDLIRPHNDISTSGAPPVARTVDSLYKHASGTRIACRAHIERQTKLTRVLITKLTCTENTAMGP